VRLSVNPQRKNAEIINKDCSCEHTVYALRFPGGGLLNKNTDRINEMWSDVLGEIANIGSGHAATSLSVLLGREVAQSLPKVMLLPLPDVAGILGGAEKVVIAGMLAISGDISGYLIMMLEPDQAEKIISMVKGETAKNSGKLSLQRFSALDKSVLSETVNIIGGSYLTAICEFTSLKAMPSIPYLCVDMIGAVLSIAMAEMGKMGDYTILFQSELSNDEEKILGNLFLIPDECSCTKIFKSLGLSDGIN
jgi:chemotaxis protein CheC